VQRINSLAAHEHTSWAALLAWLRRWAIPHTVSRHRTIDDLRRALSRGSIVVVELDGDRISDTGTRLYKLNGFKPASRTDPCMVELNPMAVHHQHLAAPVLRVCIDQFNTAWGTSSTLHPGARRRMIEIARG
jgi:hypothetical protein